MNPFRLNVEESVELLRHAAFDKAVLFCLVPLFFVGWVFSFSNWIPLAIAVWATLQYGSFQRQLLVEELNKKWKQIVLDTSPTTPLEHCEWLNKLLTQIWPNHINQKLSLKFSTIVEKRLKHRRSRLIERVELLEFSLGSCPPGLGLRGTQWSTSGNQRIMRLGFDWDTNEMSIMLLAKLGMPFTGTCRIVINSIHLKGDLLLRPILDGRAILYSFVYTPEVRIGVAFGSGGSQSLPATELPGVSSWLVKLLTDFIVRTMVEPRRRCFPLPAVDLGKKAVSGTIYVTVISATKLSRNSLRGNSSRKSLSTYMNSPPEETLTDKEDLQTFVEVEIDELSRRTTVRSGSSPVWNSTFNMILHEDTGTLRFNLYESNPSHVKYDYLASCEVKMKYAADDSTTFWAIGSDSEVIAKHSEFCGKEVQMVVPFEGIDCGELTLRLIVKEWQFSDGSHSSHNFLTSQQSVNGSSNFRTRTGRKIGITIVEGKDLSLKDKSGKCETYVKLEYGKTSFQALRKTRTAMSLNPNWNQKFEFDEIGGGEYLKIKCFGVDIFGDENMGTARVNLEGVHEGIARDVWIPLEKVNSGELRLLIEAVKLDDYEGSRGSNTISSNGWIELGIIEAKDLVAADIGGTSDPYVRVQYGILKKRTKVIFKTLNPHWNQTLEFPDDGSPLLLHVKDHNALLPTSSIGDCVVEYQRLPPNQMADKWIPLQGVKRGEIHIQITRKVPDLEKDKRCSLDSESSFTKAHQVSSQMKQTISKFQTLIEDVNLDEVSACLSELESLEEVQEEYIQQLETEQRLLINKMKELGQEILNSYSLSRRCS
ncbi:extended synaptotagmin-3-like isoform X2 [Cucurbita pepo subsp. pepo]|uniref:extended synaptotagmin-3-like isoform X2 n=1 Tax=Cucurbita pepo subsp. pepo TaxID=3664 RepID=UPI000C9D7772|nr:extended synaptotagmin-3-like isoform X2 [Cucurbita pepo subsp. pepo]